jgi:hypothetical protein
VGFCALGGKNDSLPAPAPGVVADPPSPVVRVLGTGDSGPPPELEEPADPPPPPPPAAPPPPPELPPLDPCAPPLPPLEDGCEDELGDDGDDDGLLDGGGTEVGRLVGRLIEQPASANAHAASQPSLDERGAVMDPILPPPGHGGPGTRTLSLV